MTQQQKYIVIGAITIAAIILTIVLLQFFGHSPTAAAGVAATMIAGAAAVKRTQTQAKVDTTLSTGKTLAEEVQNNSNAAHVQMTSAETDVKSLSRDQKEKEGENLFQ